MTSILAAVGDFHTNDRMGLMAPSFRFIEGNEIKPNDTQKQLHEWYLSFIDDFKHEIKTNRAKGNAWLVCNGDMVDGDIPGRHSKLISWMPSEIEEHGKQVLEPIVKITNHVIFTQGTPAHVGKSADMEEVVARETPGAIFDQKRNTHLWNYYYGEIDGVLFDIKHEGSIGRLPWTFANIINRDLTRYELRYYKLRERMPDIMIRNHNHRFYDSGNNYGIRYLANGCWKGVNDWETNKFIEPPEWGGYIIVCDKGKYEVTKKQYRLEPRRIWTLQTG